MSRNNKIVSFVKSDPTYPPLFIEVNMEDEFNIIVNGRALRAQDMIRDHNNKLISCGDFLKPFTKKKTESQ